MVWCWRKTRLTIDEGGFDGLDDVGTSHGCGGQTLHAAQDVQVLCLLECLLHVLHQDIVTAGERVHAWEGRLHSHIYNIPRLKVCACG